MKKLLGIAMLIILAIGVTGCGGSSNETGAARKKSGRPFSEKDKKGRL